MEEFAQYDAVGLAELVRRKEVTPLELVEEVIDRIERVNPTLNGVTIKMYDHARELAQGDIGNGPLAGVPFLLKDFLGEYAGVEYTSSSRFLQGFVPDRDTKLVKRFKAGGFITVAKTNLPEFAIGATTEPRLRGATHNPWDTSRTPGGSSGGAGAMVAAGVVPVAHGNDAGGSIRIPAAACGTVGLKPTRGRNPLGPYFGEVFSGFVAEHVLTRNRARHGGGARHHGGAGCRRLVSGAPSDETIHRRGRRAGRAGFASPSPPSRQPARTYTPIAPTPVRDVATLCEELGHDVVERSPDYDAHTLWLDWTTMMSAGVAWGVHGWEERIGRKAEPGDLETVHSGTRGARRRHRCARVSRPPRTAPVACPRDREVLHGARRLAHADARRTAAAAGCAHL